VGGLLRLWALMLNETVSSGSFVRGILGDPKIRTPQVGRDHSQTALWQRVWFRKATECRSICFILCDLAPPSSRRNGAPKPRAPPSPTCLDKVNLAAVYILEGKSAAASWRGGPGVESTSACYYGVPTGEQSRTSSGTATQMPRLSVRAWLERWDRGGAKPSRWEPEDQGARPMRFGVLWNLDLGFFLRSVM
jgi:hypothetical protein